MADYVKIKKSLLTAIADAIRTKFALGGTYTPAQMAEAINNVVIDGDAINENKFITGAWTEYTNDVVTEIVTGTFYNSDNLISVSFPNVTTISGDSAFKSCAKLTSINFPKLETIGVGSSGTFQECAALTTVDLPELTSVRGIYTFQQCRGLTSINVPKLKDIVTDMFYYCSSLTKIDLPSATHIENYAFQYASSLTTVILRSTTMCTISTASYANVFSNTPIASGTGYIYVPASLVDTYKADTGWSKYASQFRAIEDYPDICGS